MVFRFVTWRAHACFHGGGRGLVQGHRPNNACRGRKTDRAGQRERRSDRTCSAVARARPEARATDSSHAWNRETVTDFAAATPARPTAIQGNRAGCGSCPTYRFDRSSDRLPEQMLLGIGAYPRQLVSARTSQEPRPPAARSAPVRVSCDETGATCGICGGAAGRRDLF